MLKQYSLLHQESIHIGSFDGVVLDYIINKVILFDINVLQTIRTSNSSKFTPKETFITAFETDRLKALNMKLNVLVGQLNF